MNLYERYVEWASEKIAKHVYVPLYNSETVYKISEKMVEVNNKIAVVTGYDYLENCRKEEEWARTNPEKASLKRIAKNVGWSLLFGVYSDYKNLK